MSSVLAAPKTLPFYELELVNQFLDILKKNFFDIGLPTIIRREVITGRRKADVVAFFINDTESEIYGASLTAGQSVLFSYLQGMESVSLDELINSKRFGTSGEVIKSIIEMERVKAVDVRDNVIYPRTSNVKMVAFEAKVKNWKKAITQAAAYLKYADESYVVLPREFSEDAMNNKHLFTSSGVGLIVIDRQGNGQIEIKSKSVELHDWRRVYVYSRSLA